MPQLEMGSFLVGLGIGIRVFDDFFREYFIRRGGAVAVDVDAGIRIVLREPRYSLDRFSDPLTSHLTLDASLSIGEATTELRLQIALDLVPREEPTAPGELVFRYGGVTVEPLDDNLGNLTDLIVAQIEERVNGLFGSPTEGSIIATIMGLRLPIGAPIVEALRAQLFPGGGAPEAADWTVAARYLAAGSASEEDCIAIFVARPEEDADPPLSRSFVPGRHGLAIIYARSFLDPVFASGAASRVGLCNEEGVRLDRFSLEMQNTAIRVDGQVSEGVIEIPFEGPARPYLYRGTTLMRVHTNEIEADEPVHLIRFLRALSILIAPFAWMGLIGVGIGFAVKAFWSASNKLAGAQDTIQASLASVLSQSLAALAEQLAHTEAFEAGEIQVTMEATPNAMSVVDGNLLFFAHTFIVTEEVDMVDAVEIRCERPIPADWRGADSRGVGPSGGIAPQRGGVSPST